MTTSNEVKEMLYWSADKSWYVFDPAYKYRYRLTDKAPERARKAYRQWLKEQ